MAHCEQCGAEMSEGRLCAACAQPAPSKWPGRRVVIGFLVIVAVLALLFLGAVLYFVRHTTIVTSNPNSARVEAPFGVVTSNNNPTQLAKSLGIDVYPGAQGIKATQAELATETMASMLFHTPAAPRMVIHFYHVRFPDATVKLSPDGGTLVQFSGRDTITIKALQLKGTTQIEINDIRH
jgi:hypothetical protein